MIGILLDMWWNQMLDSWGTLDWFGANPNYIPGAYKVETCHQTNLSYSTIKHLVPSHIQSKTNHLLSLYEILSFHLLWYFLISEEFHQYIPTFWSLMIRPKIRVRIFAMKTFHNYQWSYNIMGVYILLNSLIWGLYIQIISKVLIIMED